MANFSRESRSPAVAKSRTLYYPKWLAHAAGVAIKEGHEVDFIDAPAAPFDTKYVIDRMRSKNIEAVVVETSTPSIINDIEVVEEIHAALPNVHMMMVGRHVSALPNETFEQTPSLKVIALREYDYTVRDWLAALESGASLDSVAGLMWKNDRGELIKNEKRPVIENLDELPFVSEVYKRFLHVPDYFYGHSYWPIVTFDTSRGCPYRCTFCHYPQTFSGHRMRYRSVENVADEFDYIRRELPDVKNIMFEDDTFIIDVDRTERLADELIKRNNPIPYTSNVRANVNADVRFFKKLRKSGARMFCVGIESGDDEVLKHMKKGLNLDKTHDFMKNCRDSGIMVHGCFMVGNLNETKETMQKTLDLALQLRPDTAQFYPIMVYPGTAAYEEAKVKGYLSTEDYSQWLTSDGLHNSVVNLPNISHRELVEFCDHARIKFYLNPRYIAFKAWQSLKDPRELVRNVMGFQKLVKYLIMGSFSADDKANKESEVGTKTATAGG